MKVQGIQISEAQVQAMLEAMKTLEQFRASDIEAVAVKAGVPSGEVASRAVDRIIQKQRKAGATSLIGSGPYWTAGS